MKMSFLLKNKKATIFTCLVFVFLMGLTSISSLIFSKTKFESTALFEYKVGTIYSQNLFEYLREETLIDSVVDSCKEKDICLDNGEPIDRDYVRNNLITYIPVDTGTFSISFLIKEKDICVPLTRIFAEESETRLNIRYGLKDNKIIFDESVFESTYLKGPYKKNYLINNLLYSLISSTLLTFAIVVIYFLVKKVKRERR